MWYHIYYLYAHSKKRKASPMQAISQPFALDSLRRQQMVKVLVGLNFVAYTLALLSTNWDVAEHTKGAVDSFWYPPHFGIYFSLLVAALVSACGFLLVLQAPGSLDGKIRHYLALVVLTIANIIGFTGAPFDAWWHQTYGIDLTSWSPPHLHLIIGSALVLVSCSVYFLDNQPVEARLLRIGRLDRRQWLLVSAFALAMLLGAVGFLDYESLPSSRAVPIGRVSLGLAEILARPSWSYPLAWTAFVLFMLALCTASTRIVGMATLAASIYTLARLALVVIAQTVHHTSGIPFYPVVIPAIAFDLALAFGLSRWPNRPIWAIVAAAAALAAVVLIVTVPLYWSFFPMNPNLNVYPWAMYWLGIAVMGVLFGLAGWWCGQRLRRLRP
jgi:hypothetical protein